MGWRLAARGEQPTTGFVKRFDPRFWTVNFPRPMMAAVTTTAPDALAVDAVFYRSDDLAGLIWECEDERRRRDLVERTHRHAFQIVEAELARSAAAGRAPPRRASVHASRRRRRGRAAGRDRRLVAAVAPDAAFVSGREFAGRLRARVALSRPDGARDAIGASSGGWIENGTAWASVEPAGHGALAEGDARAALSLWRVTLRPCDVRVGDHVDWGSRAMIVRVLEEDPALPDRIVAIGEECR